MKFIALLVAMTAVGVKGHGSMVYPWPRNGIDRDLKPWNGP